MIQPLAFIHPQAKVASSVQIDPFSVIHQDVEIGDGTWIGSNVTIMNGARIGKNCRIYPGAVISAEPQDLKFEGEYSITVIGDNCTIRECVTINRGTKDRKETRIGNNCLLMAYVHIAHDCIVGNNCILANSVQVGGHVTIGDFAVMGGMSAVQQFAKIGAHTMVSGGSLVNKDIPPFIKVARTPITYAGVNSVGLRRRGFTLEQINHIQDIYRIIFVSKHNTTKALDMIETDFKPTEERDEVLKFIRSSTRGILRGHNEE